MFETFAVFHLLMSLLNVALLEKRSAILVTVVVFQSAMLPYVVVVGNKETAVLMLSLVMTVSACVPGAARSTVARATSHSDPMPHSSPLR